MSYLSIQSHHSMLFDSLRNDSYAAAIKNIIQQDSVILDLGAGLGLHGFIAALNGAKKVYLVEPASIVDIAKQVRSTNQLNVDTEIISGKIEHVELPEKVDAIISVFTGNFLLTEDLLPSLFFARDKYLRKGGKLIPDRAKMEIVPVNLPGYYAKYIDCWSSPVHDVDFSLVRNYAVNNLYYDNPNKWDARFLGNPVPLLELDFMTAQEAACRKHIDIEINQNGICHGVLGWFQIRLGETWLSTSPLEEQLHWRQVFFPLRKPISVKEGELLKFRLDRPEFGEWTWIVEYGGQQQKHSTFYSEPLSAEKIQKKSENFKPLLSKKGVITEEALHLLNGSQTIAEITAYIATTYPELFPNPQQANSFIKSLVESYC